MRLLIMFLAVLVFPVARAEKPNILIILADDLGFSDLGCYGGEIETPNLDRLAQNGLRFTQFYNTARCWPTRGALMTGYYAQQIRRDVIPGEEKTTGGGNRGIRPSWASLLPTMLKPQGYRSYHIGKWHIDGMPLEGGFDRSYYLKDQSRFFNPAQHHLDDVKLPPVEKGTDFYATTSLADHTLNFLREHGEKHVEEPFFCYLAFAAPHFPLHALPGDIAKYAERYRVGWDVIRDKRFARMKEIGLVKGDLSEAESELGPPYHFPDHLEILGENEVNRPLPWDELTDGQKEFQAMKMAIHAAMIDRMDQEIGRVIWQIEQMDKMDNTLIMFFSDNGASAEIMVRGDGHDREAPMGSAETYLCLGPGWSTACNTPFRRHKTWTHEGGSSTPLIVSWPEGIAARGELRTNPGHVIDVVPTLLELTGGTMSREAPEPPGRSLAPVFEEDGTVEHEAFWWFHDGHRAIRMGDWKLVSPKDEPWELYDISVDRIESNDLSQSNPEKAEELRLAWERQLEQCRELASSK